ncbi:non-ribosomal peptide synthetase [Micromonospora echinofusca]|uniref:Amino acid adenylation domain-containing protein n=1 Tax=Micromonospora echinofusca TaxID=47858 RepID=A0ABS3VSM1_MICEH|nr:non-ribosomal peptide synthetase [Micromonospora echinofusca]MBO4207516.1 amino acid adenylation domain-containing protein [Micromonospora echinofusca]
MTGTPDHLVAVTGAACRFPGAADLDGFWRLLGAQVDAVTTPTDADLLAAGVTPDELADPDYVRAALPAPGIDRFDAAFFGLSPAEADRCDPQLRLFLDLAHTAVEQAGYDIDAVGAGTGVYAAARPGRYRGLHLLPDGFETTGDGRDEPDLAAFVADRLDLRGPAVTLGSCSLLAVHQAVQALQAGACDVAVAGGAHVELPYGHGYRWQPGARRPPDGRTRPFDAAASGCVYGSGAGVVVLRRFAEAVADGDRVLAVIRGGATGHAGRDGTGWAATVAEALVVAGCHPTELGHVEADGAATGRDDARELAALARAFRLAGGEPPRGAVPVGAVRSHVGHLGAAAGVAGLLKTILALRHRMLPATLHVDTPHPALGLADGPFRLARQPAPWPARDGMPRRAAVHAVGAGGGNTLLVVEEGHRPVYPPTPDRPRVVVWSGRHAEAADAAGTALARYFADCPPERFADAVGTLQGRTVYPVRRAAVCATVTEATRPDVIRGDAPVSAPPGVVLAFPGTGPVPRGLYGVQPVFTEAADVCLDATGRHGLDLYDAWTAGSTGPVLAGAATFVTQYALAEMWRAWGIRPAAVLGTGAGVLAAAVAAGALPLDQAAALLARPGRVTWSASPVPIWSTADGRVVDGLSWPAADGDDPPTGVPDALRTMLGSGRHVLLTVDPVGADGRLGPVGADATGDPRDGDGDADPVRHLMTALARLWVAGVDVDWPAVEPDHPLRRIPLPGVPLHRERHWVVPNRGPAAPQRHHAPAPAPAPVVATTAGGLPVPAVPLRPLGRTEHAFWVLDQLAPDSGVSTIGIAFRTARPLRWWPLQTAVDHLLRRHPALRLRFPDLDGTPVRHLTPADGATVPVPTRATTGDRLVADLQEFLHAPFDLGRDLLFRAAHFTLPDGASVVALAAHHIVVDAPSIQILVEEFGRIYDGITTTGQIPADLTGEAPLLAVPQPAPESTRYWLDHLRGADPAAMVLPGARPTPARPTFAGHTCSWSMTAAAQEAMGVLRQRLHTSDNVVLMSAFCLTLLRHGAGPDLIVGVPVGTRRPATRQQVGYGVSTMPLRVRVDPAAGFADLVRRVGDAFFAGIEHADATVEQVLTERGHGTGDWRVPLFRHMFNYRPWSDEKIRVCGEVPDYIEDLFDRSRLDLQCIAVPEPDRFTLRCWHSTEVHDEADVAAFVARMQALLVQAAADPEHPVVDLPFGSPADEATGARVNDTGRDWGTPGSVADRVAARAVTTPDAVAVVDGDRRVSYRELRDRATAVRDLLRAHRVGPGDLVALALGRSVELAAAVLGVWATGAGYLPLAPGQPAGRLAYQVDDAGARVVLAAGDTPTDWSTVPVLVVPADGATADGPLRDSPVDPDTCAYAIHTSGSTGRPKAVAVTHRNLLNLVCDFADRLGADAARAVLWSTAPTFDISALELLLPLLTGGTVVVAPDGALLRPRDMLGLVVDRDVSLVQATPTAWRMLAPETGDELTGRVLLCGGEPMPAALARRLRALGGRVYNVYGPTETTIWSTVAELTADPEDPVPIGVPLANTRVFVADPHGRPLPPGVPGELCIAGDGVAAGYLHRPELTAERFGEHPGYGRFYRTGDVARLRHDGVLELSGRTDRQVKLRGHRIELDEVEAVLHEHPEVTAAAVTVRGDPQDDGRLVAFVQVRTDGGDHGGVRERLWRHARAVLPDAAVPSGIVVLDRLPTTVNGKVDHRALHTVEVDPAPATAPGADPGGADPELVAALTGLWREALRRPGLGPDDNFFLNGGHSILAARLVTRIEQITGHPAGMQVVFTHPTPAALAAYLAGPAGGGAG